MRGHGLNARRIPQLRPLAACLAVAFSANALAGSAAVNRPAATIHAEARPHGMTISPRLGAESHAAVLNPADPAAALVVKNCNDAGPDSLRELVTSAVDGATIEFDLSQMQCSTITLTSGQINITNDNLTLQGPATEVVTIDGGHRAGHYNRIFNHTGIGTLTINALLITDAAYVANANQNPKGGCIYSAGAVALTASTVSECHLTATAGLAAGGGIFAQGLTMAGSTVNDSVAASSNDAAVGGGVCVGSAGFSAKYSTIENNVAHSYSPNFEGSGGGIAVHGSLDLQFSTVAENHAEHAGGAFVFGLGTTAMITDSTFSGNSALTSGGMDVQGLARLYNVTLAFNRATAAGGIAGIHTQSLVADGSIFAYNVTDDGNTALESDVQSDDGIITGAKNLIIAANATMPPADTSTECPRLAPLLNNGGYTRTHALLADSPAIDAGNNTQSLQTDQRGTGFDRVVGPFADIGAYEWNAGSGDVISMSGFEGCN